MSGTYTLKKLFYSAFAGMLFFSCTTDPIPENNIAEKPQELDKPIIKDEPEMEVEFPITDEPSAVSALVRQMQYPSGLLESAAYTDFVSLYDNSLAAILFIDQGDIARAEKIFDFFNSRQEEELLMGTGGFYQSRNTQGNEGGRTWMGDNAWLLIALNHYEAATGNTKYASLSRGLESWLRSLQNETGGLSGGFNEDGSKIPMVTEGIITAFNAVKGYDGFHKNILRFLKEKRWDNQEMVLVASPDVPRYNFALDLHSLGYSIFPNYANSVLEKADRYKNTQVATLTGEFVTGYCFDEDVDVVWLEGTAQMAVAFYEANMPEQAEILLKEIEKTMIPGSKTRAKGIPYTANFGTTYGATDLWDHADTTPALSSGIWYVFAKTGLNPFALGKNKNIPQVDMFWNAPEQSL